MPIGKTTSQPPPRMTETGGATSIESGNKAQAKQKTGSFFGRRIQRKDKHPHSDKVAPDKIAEQAQDTQNSTPLSGRKIIAQPGASMTGRPLPPLPPGEEDASSDPIYDQVYGTVSGEEEIYSTAADDPVYATLREATGASLEDDEQYVEPATVTTQANPYEEPGNTYDPGRLHLPDPVYEGPDADPGYETVAARENPSDDEQYVEPATVTTQENPYEEPGNTYDPGRLHLPDPVYEDPDADPGYETVAARENPSDDEQYVEPAAVAAQENTYDLHPEDPPEDKDTYENPVPDPGYETVRQVEEDVYENPDPDPGYETIGER